MTLKINTLLLGTSILLGFAVFGFSNVYAAQVSVSIPMGSASPGCEETNSCYVPHSVKVHPNDEVIWSNDDSAAHTVTSGSPSEGPDNEFDSGMLMSGATFTHKFGTLGQYPYYCIVHPWMQGDVLVTVGGGVEVDLGKITIGGEKPSDGAIVVGEPDEKKTTVNGISSDGKIRVEITSTKPVANEPLELEIGFRDSSGGGLKQHANYDIIATQNGKEVLSMMRYHQHEDIATMKTSTLESDGGVDITITMLGFGLPGNEPNWTGPKGEVLMFNVVPEFGTIAIIVLAISISAIVALRYQKSGILPKL